MTRLKIQGIIVGALPFRDYDCIATLFAPDEGLIKLFIRAAYASQKIKGAGITTPLTIVDAVISKGRSDLYTCHEISVVTPHLDLRKNLSTLNAACDMLQAISATQQPGKSAPELYQLLIAYLQRLPAARCPLTIACSFRLKLQRYEGLFGFLSHCCACAAPLTDAWINEGEAYCREHSQEGSRRLSDEERSLVEQLGFNRDFSQLASLSASHALRQKISEIYKFTTDAQGKYEF